MKTNPYILVVLALCTGACAKSDEVRQLRQQVSSLNEELSKAKSELKEIQRVIGKQAIDALMLSKDIAYPDSWS
jgi:septal ring factor EnvC (AmiA/AmiB activator)